MARTGRPPKPIEVKRRNGNPGQRKLPDPSKTIALQPADGIPPVPMTLAESGRGMWTTIWSGPAKAWLAPSVDALRVQTVCQLSDDIAGYHRDIVTMGTLLEEPIVTPTGQVVGQKIVANPLVKMRNDALKILDRELTSLAFDPVSRSRLGLAEVKRQSKLEELLGRRNEGTQEESIEADIIDIAADD